MYTICMQIYFSLKLDGNESDSYHEKVSGRFHLVELTRFSLDGHFPPTWKPNYKAEAKIKSIIKMFNMKMQFPKQRISISCLHVKIRYFIHLSKSPQLHYCLSRAALASTGSKHLSRGVWMETNIKSGLTCCTLHISRAHISLSLALMLQVGAER